MGRLPHETLVCAVCGVMFKARPHADRKFCSVACRKREPIRSGLTAEMRTEIARRVHNGHSLADVANEYRLSAKLVHEIEGLVKKAALVERKCLGCQKLFPSAGAGNRLCDKCSSVSAGIA